MPQGIIDLGYWGLKQQPYGADGAFNQNSTNDPLICSSASCGSMTIGQLTARFPNYTAFLSGQCGFSNADIIGRTYPTMVYGEAALNSYQNRETIYIPPGIWYFNTEMRSGQSRNIGAGPQGNAGSNGGGGGTFLRMVNTNWKSIHGAQNNGLRILMHCWTYGGEAGTTPQPIVQGFTGYEYMHHMTLENCTVQGTAAEDSFWTPGDTEVLFMMENAGERTKVENCHFWKAKGFAVLVSKNTARPAIMHNSFFYNQIAAIGVRGGTRGKCILMDASCDNNPYVLFMYQSGSNVFGTGAFLPQAYAGIPGGNWSFNDVKVEAFACRSGGYDGMQACPVGGASFYGRGGMFARVTGRASLNVKDSTLFAHGGTIWTAVEFVDQNDMAASFPGQGWGSLASDNLHVNIKNSSLYGVQNWLADYKRQRVHPWGNTNGDLNRLDFNWNNYPDNGAAWANSPTGPVAWGTAVATHKGIQPFINSAQAYAWTGGAPNFNYHPVTGANF